MRITHIFCVFMILFISLPAIAQQQQTTPQMSEENKKMMEMWMKLATPGEPHKKLMTLAGSYSIASRSKMDPAAEFVKGSGTCEKKPVLGERYLMEHCEGDMPGMPQRFEGMGMLGYNNYTKQYEYYWFDNMSTMGFAMKGTADPAGKVITVKGSYEDPATKGMKNSRWVWTIQDANRHKLEIYETDPKGTEYMGAEISYTRK